jgi:hypothetical protein
MGHQAMEAATANEANQIRKSRVLEGEQFAGLSQAGGVTSASAQDVIRQ